MLPVLKSDMQP